MIHSSRSFRSLIKVRTVGAAGLVLFSLAVLTACNTESEKRTLESEIFTAAKVGHLSLFRHLLARGGKANWHDIEGNTVPTIAAVGKHWDIVEALLAASPAWIQSRGAGGNTLLHIAAHQGDLVWTRKLAEMGAGIDLLNVNNGTPLHLAAFSGSVEVVEFLLKSGADKNRKNNYGESPLHVATWTAHRDVVEHLLAAGADTSIKAVGGENLLHYAAISGGAELIRVLLPVFQRKGGQAPRLDERTRDGLTPLMLSIKRGDLEGVSLLLAAGADSRMKTLGGEACVDLAKRTKNAALIHLFEKSKK